MSETVDALREIWTCTCGADGRAKQVYADARRVAITRVGDEDLVDSTGGYLFAVVLFSGGHGRSCPVCANIPWRLQPEAPFTLTRRDERALACMCGGGGERAAQNFNKALAAYEAEMGVSGYSPPNGPSCVGGCGYGCWYIQPGVEAYVVGINTVPMMGECVACGGAGKVVAPSIVSGEGVRNVRKLLVM